VQQVHTAEKRARETTGGATEAVGARDDRRRYGSCRRVRRPAALRKLSARETTGRATEAAGARDERDQWRRPPDERHQRGTSETSAERD
jgi:hypothetical protein